MWTHIMRRLFGSERARTARQGGARSADRGRVSATTRQWRVRPSVLALEDRVTPAAHVYVDADWTGTPLGADPGGPGPAGKTFGTDAFATIQSAVNTAGVGALIDLLKGPFPENVVLNVDG